MPLPQQDIFLKECLRVEAEMEQGKTFFSIHNSLILNKGLMYMSVTPKGQHCMVLNGVHHDAGHQGQQRTLALAQERFWWPMMAEDCHTIVKGCPHCQAFEGEVPRAPLCLIQVYAPLELVHLDYTSIEFMMELNKPPHGEECPRDNGPFHKVCPCGGDEGPDCQDCHKGVLRALHSSFWGAHKVAE